MLSGSFSRWNISFEVIATPGHTPGCSSYKFGRHVFTGDALFACSIGRTDIPGASSRRLLNNIRKNLLTLPEETRVLPGHGPESTIGAELRSNPFFA